MEGEGAGAALIVGALVGNLNDSDILLAERLSEDGSRTGDPRRPFAECRTKSLGQRQPFLAEPRRLRQEAIAAGILPAIECLFQERDIIHDAATISERAHEERVYVSRPEDSWPAGDCLSLTMNHSFAIP